MAEGPVSKIPDVNRVEDPVSIGDKIGREEYTPLTTFLSLDGRGIRR
jgi:hypothetical protein